MRSIFVNGEFLTAEEFEEREMNLRKANSSLYDIHDQLDDLDNLIFQTLELIGENDPGLSTDLEKVQRFVEEAMKEVEKRI